MRVAQEHVTHPDQAFRFLRFEVDRFRAGRHRHHAVELTWIEQGAGVRFVGDSAEPFDAGDLVLLGGQVPHAWISSTLGGPQRSVASVIQFPPELLIQPLLPELAALRPLAAQAGRGLRIVGDSHGRVTERMCALREGDALGRLAGLISLLGALIHEPADLRPIATSAMLDAAGDAHETAGPLQGRIPEGAARRYASERSIDRVIGWIHQHLAEPMALADVAQVAHISPAAFSRYFRRETGKTFSAYVNDVRCSEACVRLRRSSHPVAAIAEACGFATASHFNRQFLARVGMTPRTYRRAG
jgi:AraC-like DNA-binding protein